jgi:hypothetical protein
MASIKLPQEPTSQFYSSVNLYSPTAKLNIQLHLRQEMYGWPTLFDRAAGGVQTKITSK